MTTDLEFAALWMKAQQAAQIAANAEDAKLGPEGKRGLDCGFAWISFPGNIPFARWAKKTGLVSKAYPSWMQIWYSKVYDCHTQSISVHEAACRAARDILAHGLQTSQIQHGLTLRLTTENKSCLF